MLLFENSRRFDRALTMGIARYARSHGPWAFYKTPVFYLREANVDNSDAYAKSLLSGFAEH